MAVMLRKKSSSSDPAEYDYFDGPDLLVAAYGASRELRRDLLGAQFWRDEIRLEATKREFRRRAVIPWVEVDFATEDTGMTPTNFVEYTEADDDTAW